MGFRDDCFQNECLYRRNYCTRPTLTLYQCGWLNVTEFKTYKKIKLEKINSPAKHNLSNRNVNKKGRFHFNVMQNGHECSSKLELISQFWAKIKRVFANLVTIVGIRPNEYLDPKQFHGYLSVLAHQLMKLSRHTQHYQPYYLQSDLYV